MGASQPILGFYDRPMWTEMEAGIFVVQHCTQCDTSRYPPGPACPACQSLEYQCKSAGGGGEILSWIIFHRQYFDDHPAPYNSVAVRLDEGPIVVTNLVGPEPAGSWIGKRVRFEVIDHAGRLQHAARLLGSDA
jgi:uncharacterized OB-fold protein